MLYLRRRCDGHSDCNDGADEVSCLQYECAYWQLKCEESGVCVHSGLACDGRQDCPDGTDEINCHTANNCTADQFTCVLHQARLHMINLTPPEQCPIEMTC